MKIQLRDTLGEYNIETIDLSIYNLENDEGIELLKNDLAEILVNYYMEEGP